MHPTIYILPKKNQRLVLAWICYAPAFVTAWVLTVSVKVVLAADIDRKSIDSKTATSNTLILERHLGDSNLVNIYASDRVKNPADAAVNSVVMLGAVAIEGDSISLLLDRKMQVIGNALLIKDSQHITGNKITYDLQNDEIEVQGNAKLVNDNTELIAPAMRLRLNEFTGSVPDASITIKKAASAPVVGNHSALLNEQNALLLADPKQYLQNQLSGVLGVENESLAPGIEDKIAGSRADAKLVLFEGEDKKILKKARYTTCAADSDAWYIKARNIELNDYTQSGSATNVHVEFMGVPILYTPWIDFSYSNQRKSGFLAPTIGTTSRSGFEVLTPYYWNIRPNMDATLSARYLSKRGGQALGELRYLEENYSGIHNLEYLDNDSLSGQNRYYGKLTHRHNLGSNWSAGFNVEKVSDAQYFSELTTGVTNTSRVNLPQEAYVNYQDNHWLFNGLIQRYQNLDSISHLYHRLPQLTLSSRHDLSVAKAETSSQWVYFDRDNAAPQAAVGGRFTTYPSLSLPMKRSFGYITPKIGVNYANYSLNNNQPSGFSAEQNQLSRTLPIFSLDSGLYFDRQSQLFETEYTATLEPRLYYLSIPYRDQRKIPIFDTSLADLNQTTLYTENQFSGPDRINEAHQVSIGLTSRLIKSDSGVERISATVGQRFYLNKNDVVLPGQIVSERASSDILAGLTARLSSRLNLDAFWQYDPDQLRTARSNFLAYYNPEPGKVINFGYRFARDVLEQVDVAGQWPLRNGWYGIGRFNYSILERTPVEVIGGLEYDAGCWQARSVVQRIETATAEANYAFFFQLELGGLTSIGANPLNLLRRSVPGYQSTSDIPEFYRNQNFSQ